MIEYWNEGTEWIIDGCHYYAHALDSDAIRAELAAAAGVEPSELELYAFDGWRKEPKYRLA